MAIRQTWSWLTVVLLAIVLQTLTAPIGAHLIGRTANQRGEIKDAGETVYRHLHLPVPGKDAPESDVDLQPHPSDKYSRVVSDKGKG